ncbi:hypothetical protein CONLIGDRAFT_391036 [Coniochaeta ligniaria NRRL 30616]|uniref:Rhodopsin domain-containing protein n=1 Tax=Coniochaeta ligniaria NRRL 30616 TaxID=1408157 RepID=A0A1J7INK1_9PEZI|nr:hypothetical protein CONLIGDRAFT_391036 [Coniochaeta ligniaria NRRL 30616]
MYSMPLIHRLLAQRGFGPGPDGAQSRENVIYGFMGGFAPLAFIAVCLRLYSRWRFSKLGYDDLAVAVGFILYMGLIIATIFAIKYGLGLHIWDVPYDVTGVSMQKCGFTSQVLYPTSLGAIKLSVILFLLRTLPPVHFWRKPLYAFATWIVVEETVFTIGLFLQCRPIAYYWDKSLSGTCFDQPSFYYVDAALNMTTDLCILALPWLLFRSMHATLRPRTMSAAQS